MKLIKKVGAVTDNSGKTRHYGLFRCPQCLQPVKKKLSEGRLAKHCSNACLTESGDRSKNALKHMRREKYCSECNATGIMIKDNYATKNTYSLTLFKSKWLCPKCLCGDFDEVQNAENRTYSGTSNLGEC